ncbi:MAG: alanine racemase [Candidatus Lokiarchaeota archaeon]|nr:alanine racemase [Candidatus Lokiarchaeota archaeon]
MKKLSGNPYLIKKEGKLLIGDILVSEILKKHTTPFMIFLANRVKNNINSFCRAFQSVFDNFQCFYSFKANFLPDICRIVRSEGIGAELIGLPELKLALKLQFPAEKIIVGGPYLPQELIEKCITENIKEIVVYNLNDIILINSIAKRYEKIQEICLRVNTQKFGSRLGTDLDEFELTTLKKIKNECKNVKITTILSHYSTQMNNFEQFRHNLRSVLEKIKKLLKAGLRIENINLGGGFPEAAIMPEHQLIEIAKKIKLILTNFDIKFKNIYFEPGRYFVGDAGILMAKVIKVYKDRWIFLNIGNHICPKFAKASLRFYNVSRINDPHKYKTSFAGIVPTDQDVLAKNYFFTKELNEGDIVMITNVGAYCLTFSNRFPYLLPEISLIEDGNITQIFDPIVHHDFSLK